MSACSVSFSVCAQGGLSSIHQSWRHQGPGGYPEQALEGSADNGCPPGSTVDGVPVTVGLHPAVELLVGEAVTP